MLYQGALFAVEDIRRARKFYEEVLGQKVMFDFGTNLSFERGLTFQEGFCELVGLDPASRVVRSHNTEIYFEEDEIEKVFEKVKAYPGIELLHGLQECPWGQRTFRFYDLDKHIVEIGESMEFVVKRFLRMGLSVEETCARSQFPPEIVRQLSLQLENEKD